MVFKNETENAEIPYVFVMPFVDFTGNDNKLGTYYIHNVEKDGENLKMADIYEHCNNELYGYKEDLLYTIHMSSKKPNIDKLLQFYFEFSKDYFKKTLKHKIFQIYPTQFDLDKYITEINLGESAIKHPTNPESINLFTEISELTTDEYSTN